MSSSIVTITSASFLYNSGISIVEKPILIPSDKDSRLDAAIAQYCDNVRLKSDSPVAALSMMIFASLQKIFVFFHTGLNLKLKLC